MCFFYIDAKEIPICNSLCNIFLKLISSNPVNTLRINFFRLHVKEAIYFIYNPKH